MEKRVWTKPLAEVEQFMANEYIAKCDDTTNKYYKFVCDAGRSGWDHYVYFEDNGVEGLQKDGDYYRGYGYHPCGKVHYAKEENTDFITGYISTSRNGTYSEVVIWKGEDNNNVHCTTALKDQIEVVPGNRS